MLRRNSCATAEVTAAPSAMATPSALACPKRVDAGRRVAHAGRSSVRYELALFSADSDTASAQGHFIHVYVDRATRRPVELPDALRAALEPLIVTA